MTKRNSQRSQEMHFMRISVAGVLPALLVALVLLWLYAPWSIHAKIFLSGVCLLSIGCSLFLLPQQMRQQWRALSNVVEAIKEEDFSLRGPGSRDSGAYGELVREINALAHKLQQEQLQGIEKQKLLEKVIRDIDVSIFAFNEQQQLTLANPAALRLLQMGWSEAIKQSVSSLQFESLLKLDKGSVVEHQFPLGTGSWGIRVEQFIDAGKPNKLLFVTDLQQVLHAEERRAWQRLIRVLSHEVNNSMTPIASVSSSLLSLIHNTDVSEWREDVTEGLRMMQERSLHLAEFIGRYAEWARCPPPHKRPFDLVPLLRRVVEIYQQAGAQLHSELDQANIFADPVQIEQLLMNLLKNAVEANGKGSQSIQVELIRENNCWRLRIMDEGSGIQNSSNLFVPFYSTKNKGSGIGLVLSRQIAQAHGGNVFLVNRTDRTGAIAELQLPRFSANAVGVN